MDEEIRLFSLTEAAKYLGVKRHSLKLAYYDGDLPGQKVSNTLVFSQAQLDWFGNGRVPAEKPAPPELYGFDDAAAYLEVHRRTIEYNYYVSFQLKGQKVANSVVFTRAQLEAFRRVREARQGRKRPAWVPVEDRIRAALKQHRGWEAPRVWKGNHFHDRRRGWWAVGPSGRSEYLGKNMEQALEKARKGE